MGIGTPKSHSRIQPIFPSRIERVRKSLNIRRIFDHLFSLDDKAHAACASAAEKFFKEGILRNRLGWPDAAFAKVADWGSAHKRRAGLAPGVFVRASFFHAQFPRRSGTLVIIAPLAVVVTELIYGQLVVATFVLVSTIDVARQGDRRGQFLRSASHTALPSIERSANQGQIKGAWGAHSRIFVSIECLQLAVSCTMRRRCTFSANCCPANIK
jgi:hypothetical protein